MIHSDLSSEDLLNVLNFSCDGIFIYDSALRLVYANKAAMEGCQLDVTALGRYWNELKKYGYFYGNAALDVYLNKKEYHSEFITRTGKHMLCTATPILDKNGNIKYIISNVRYIASINSIRQSLLNKQKDKINSEKDFIYASPQMKEIASVLGRVAQTDLPVILCGETGVGKSDLAEQIHNQSLRAESPFIAINCGAVPPSLCEAEFFGYEKGAFTGADKIKVGIFESADNGTLFLDEIGELPLFMQVKLLRVLQERKIKRLGSTKEIKINVRIITATNKNIKEMINKKQFREDLFHRLNGFEVVIPPLRERREDIRLLIDYFLHQYNIKYSTSKSLSHELQAALEEYSYFGNVRELSYLIERLVVLSADNIIDCRFLSEEMMPSRSSSEEVIPLKRALENTEKNLLIKAKRRYKTTRAIGKVLGISHVSVAQKLKAYNIV